MKTAIDIALRIAHTLSNDNGKFGYFPELMEAFKDEENYEIAKTKMDNLVEKLNSLEGAEITEYLNRDFETEIWFEI